MRKHATRIALLLFPTTVVFLLLIPAAFAQTVLNGSFEEVQISPLFNSHNPADIPHWTHSGDVGEALLWAVGYSDCCGEITTAGAGKQFVTLGGGYLTPGTAHWKTTITGLTSGNSYNLSFMTATEQGPDFPGPQFAQSMTVSFLLGSSTAPQSFNSPLSSDDYWQTWVTQSYPFVATDISATVDFSVSNQADDIGLDNVTLSAVPEPSSLLLFATGLLGMVGAMRRKLVG